MWTATLWYFQTGYSASSLVDLPLIEWPFPASTHWSDVGDLFPGSTWLPGSGALRAHADYVIGDTLHQAIWRGDHGFTRTVPIVSGAPQWSQASAWSDPIDPVPGRPASSAQAIFVANDELYQSIWYGDDCYAYVTPIVNGQPDWPATLSSGPQTSTAPGPGDTHAAASFVTGDGEVHHSLWRGGQMYTRSFTVQDAYGDPVDQLCQATADDWTLVDTSNGPGAASVHSAVALD